MSDRSGIEWTDATWNPTTGCTRVSSGCDHCYIERTPPFRMAHRSFNGTGPGSTTGVQLHPDRLDQPLRWRKPRRVFVNSLSDLFHADIPDEYIARVFAVMALAPQHTFQILTKRPARMASLLAGTQHSWLVPRHHSPFVQQILTALEELAPTRTGLIGLPLRNVHLGVSVDDQATADLRIPKLLDTPAAVRFLSCEPLLGGVDLTGWRPAQGLPCRRHNSWLCQAGQGKCEVSVAPIDWVIVGGESGPDARPMHPQWARDIRDQCVAAGVPFHFKQWGEWVPAPWKVAVCDPHIGWQGTDAALQQAKAHAESVGATHGVREADGGVVQFGHKPWSLERADHATPGFAGMRRPGKKAAGRELDGRTWDEQPAHAPAASPPRAPSSPPLAQDTPAVAVGGLA